MDPIFCFEESRPPECRRVAERELINRYPLAFRAAFEPISYCSAIGTRGIETGEGWFPLIEDVVAMVERELHQSIAAFDLRQHLTWLDRRLQNLSLTAESEDYLLRRENKDVGDTLLPACVQIKEKFGTLRIRMRWGLLCPAEVRERIQAAIDAAFAKAEITCENCGQPGQMRTHGVAHVACERCEAKHIQERQDTR